MVGKSYQTKDGKYLTVTRAADFNYHNGKKVEYNVGYAYWYDRSDNSKIGHTSYDYLFFVGKVGIDQACDVLNRVIN